MSVNSEQYFRIQHSLKSMTASEYQLFSSCWLRFFQEGRFSLWQFWRVSDFFQRKCWYYWCWYQMIPLMNVLASTFQGEPRLKINCLYVDILNEISCFSWMSLPDVSSELTAFLYRHNHQFLKLEVSSVCTSWVTSHPLQWIEHIAVACTHNLFVSKVILQNQNSCHMEGMSGHMLENNVCWF